MSTKISPHSGDARKPEHVGVDLFDMVLWPATGPSVWLKGLTHEDMEREAERLADARWVVLDIREQYMCSSEENEIHMDTGLAQVYIREDKEVLS